MKQDEVGSKETVDTDAVRDLLTVEQAASYLHMPTSSIRSYIRQGSQAFAKQNAASRRSTLQASARSSSPAPNS